MFGLTATWQIKLVEYLIVIALVFGVVYYVYHEGYSRCEQDVAVAQAKANKAQQEKYDKVAADYETLKNTRQQNVNTITKEITHIIDKPIYAVACVDDSGRMLINDALAGRAASKQSNSGLPATTTP